MKLSIITICLNDIEGLKKTVQSVVGQSFKDYEYIVVDGASNDGTVEFLKAQGKGITHIISEKDNGIYNAMNKGIKLAKGDYCLFLNSGDYLANGDVLMSVFLQNRDNDILYGNMIIENDVGSRRHGKMPKDLSFIHMIQDTLWHPVSFIRRSLFESYGMYDETLKMVSDYDFFLKVICLHKVSTSYLNFPIAVFNLKGFSSLPQNRNTLQMERSIVQKRYFSEQLLKDAYKKIEFNNSFLGRIMRKLGFKG
jgi:glycosyltransferase involved in cell wall biosynthesis